MSVAQSDGRPVLLVEDDVDVREILAEILQELGFSVAVAGNGLEALEYLRTCQRCPALILLDLRMPVMDGFQFREEQEKNGDWAAIPVVVLSADGNMLDNAERARAAHCLRKPVELTTLLEVLASIYSPHAD